jgi:Holliday junction resolvase
MKKNGKRILLNGYGTMNSQRQGLNYEHTLASDVFELTDGRVIPVRAGWSGNQAPPMPDLLIPFGGVLIAVEIKSSKNPDSIIVEPEDLADIRYWTLKMSEVPVYPYLSIKWRGRQNRLLYPTRLERVGKLEKSFEYEADSCPFDCTVTRTGNISFRHPNTGNWPGTAGGNGPAGKRDAYRLLRTLEEENYEHPPVSEIIKQRDDYFDTIQDASEDSSYSFQ